MKNAILALFEALPAPAQNRVSLAILREAAKVCESPAARGTALPDGFEDEDDGPVSAAIVCTRAKPGWTCSREPGHEGPCAARPIPQARLVTHQVWILGLEDAGRDVATFLAQYCGYTNAQADRTVIEVQGSGGGPVAVYTTTDHLGAVAKASALVTCGARVEIRQV